MGIRRPMLALVLLATGHAVIHALSALMPLVYPIVVREFGLNAADIGTFIAITTAVGGLMQVAYGFVTRYVARPLLLAAGQLLFGVSLLFAGTAASIGTLLTGISASRIGASPQHPVGNAFLSDAFPPERRGFAISAHIAGGNLGTILVPLLAGSACSAPGCSRRSAGSGRSRSSACRRSSSASSSVCSCTRTTARTARRPAPAAACATSCGRCSRAATCDSSSSPRSWRRRPRASTSSRRSCSST